jgi:hypothetical protein
LTISISGVTPGCSNSTRGLFGGGSQPATTNVIGFVTIATTGNAQDFGDLTVARGEFGACSSSTRGIWAGGNSNPTRVNVIDYVTILSTGNAQDFGDLGSFSTNSGMTGLSNGHGGL